MSDWTTSTDGAATADASWAEMLRGRNLILSLVLSGGVILSAIDIYITATLLPSVVKDIGGLDYYAWNTTLFVVASIVGAAVTGRILGAVGPRRSYVLAGALFFAGCLLAASAPDIAVLLTGRLLQGLGGGMLLALCYSMIMVLLDERLWPRAIAMLSAMWGIATMTGPALGGIFAELGDWRMGFGIQLPITAVYIALTCLVLPRHEKREEKTAPIPLPQLVLLTGSALTVSVAGTLESYGGQIAGVLAAALMITLLIRQEKRSTARIFPQGSFDRSNPLFLAFLTLSLFCVCENAEFFMPFFLQNLHGLLPLVAGYVGVMIAAGWAVTEVISARLTGAAGDRAIVLGPLLLLSGMALLAVMVPGDGQHDPLHVALIGGSLFLAGSGIGLAWPHLITRIFQHSTQADRDIAASALSTAQLYAIALGAALSGLIVNAARLDAAVSSNTVISGISNGATWLFLALCGVAFIAVFSAGRLAKTNRSPEPNGPRSRN